MTTLKEILDYMDKVPGRVFETKTLIKTDEQYHNAYRNHAKACNFICSKVNGKIITLGEEVPPEQDVFIKTDRPDYVFYKNKRYVLFDVKYKSNVRYFGWVNVRAYERYKRCSDDLNIPLYVVSTDLDNIGNFSMSSHIINRNQMAWDGNLVHIFEYADGIPFDFI